jgi:hypothetical protein
VADLKHDVGWDQAGGDARRWWGEFEGDHAGQWNYLASILRELKDRKTTITDLFLASVNGGGGLGASFDYLDYAKYFAAVPQKALPRTPIREHPFMALRAPVRVHWATVVPFFVGKDSKPVEDTEVQTRFHREHLDVLLRSSSKAAKDRAERSVQLKGIERYPAAIGKAHPNDPFCLDLRAVEQFATGHPDEALRGVERGLAAAEAMPPSPRRDRAIRLLRRHREEFRGGLPKRVPEYRLGSPRSAE